MNKTYTLYSDPGHGWLQVQKKELEELNIINNVSEYSYINGEFVYLEEDCDMSRFMEAATAAGWKIKTADFHTDNESSIRLLKGYQSTAAARQSIADFYDNNPNLTLAELSRFTGKSVPALKQFLMERK